MKQTRKPLQPPKSLFEYPKSYTRQIKNLLAKSESQLEPFQWKIEEKIDKENNIEEEAQARAERIRIENEGIRQDIELKKTTLKKLFQLLTAETIAIFILSILQGAHMVGFKLEEWSFKLLVSATIIQISYMVTVAVKHLFPEKK